MLVLPAPDVLIKVLSFANGHNPLGSPNTTPFLYVAEELMSRPMAIAASNVEPRTA